MKNNDRLGRGLDALFGGNANDIISEIENNHSEEEVVQIPLNEISPNPYQPRKIFDEDKLEELKISILEHGVFTPIIVKKTSSGYNIVAGERRYRASQNAKLETIPALIVDFDDKLVMEIALLENIQREDLNSLEEAKAIKKIMDKFEYTQEQVGKKLGKSRSHIANTLRLLSLNNKVQDLLLNGDITMGHAKILIGLEDYIVSEIIDIIIKDNLSVRDSELLVSKYKDKKPEKKQSKKQSIEHEAIEKQIREKFGMKVKLSEKNLVINYENDEDLNKILDILDISID